MRKIRCESLNEEARGICKLEESCNNVFTIT